MRKLRLCDTPKAKQLMGGKAETPSQIHMHIKSPNFPLTVLLTTKGGLWHLPFVEQTKVHPNLPRRYRGKRGEGASRHDFPRKRRPWHHSCPEEAHINPLRGQKWLELGPEAKGNWSGDPGILWRENPNSKSPTEIKFWCLSLGLVCATYSCGAALGSGCCIGHWGHHVDPQAGAWDYYIRACHSWMGCLWQWTLMFYFAERKQKPIEGE